jgi:hypothetical protein
LPPCIVAAHTVFATAAVIASWSPYYYHLAAAAVVVVVIMVVDVFIVVVGRTVHTVVEGPQRDVSSSPSSAYT